MNNNGVILKIAATVGMLVLFTSCLANAAIADNDSLTSQGGSAPGTTLTSTPTEEPTAVIEPTATEMPPEVDLGWHNWMIFKDFFGGTNEEITEELLEDNLNPEDSDKAIYMFIARNAYMHQDRMFPYQTVTPENNPGWNYVESINGDEVGLSLDLNDVEKEILEQFILFRKDQGSKLRLFLFIGDKQEGREIRDFFDKEGAFVLIEDAEVFEDSEDEKNFKVTIYEQEDIPWDIIPEEVWDDIAEGNVMLDLRGGRVNCFANVNDIRGGVTPR